MLMMIFMALSLSYSVSQRVKMAERYDCTECEESLYGQKYILKEESPFCIKCYEKLFSSTCEVCQKLISCTSKVTNTHVCISWVKAFLRASFSAGFVVQGAPLAQRVLPLRQVQPVSGGPALRHQGRPADVHRLLQQRVLCQVPCVPEDHHAR